MEPTGLILKAADFAARKHHDQRRKGIDAAPYINHPIELANLLWHQANVRDEVTIAAALLHDTVEDTDTTLADLHREFGTDVQNVVAEVTDDKSLPKETRKQLQVEHAPHLSDRARLVKLADKISNLREVLSSPPEDWSQERKLAYFNWGKDVIDQIRGTHADLERMFDEIYQQGVNQFKGGET
ncbi:MAG TPA: HD domain-containing protein [Elainellaceae cyanobacterium]|jgi:guanosine-3',5'-bis(diphosphate) 3'-pyrophosphohydrolase